MLLCSLTAGRGVAKAQGAIPRFERDVAVSVQSTDNVMPVYPALLRVAQEGGNAVAAFVVDTLGHVYSRSIQIAHATHPDFATATMEAIPDLRFVPAVDRSGHKVPQLVRQAVVFRWLKGGMTQVTVRNEGCTLENRDDFNDVAACASPPVWRAPKPFPFSWGWTLGGENVTGAPARSVSYSPGVVLGAQLQYPLPSPHFALRVDGMLHTFAQSVPRCGVTYLCGDIVGGNPVIEVVTAGFGLVARLNGRQVRWSPYLVGGVGANISSGGEDRGDFTSRSVGLQGGVGFEFRLRKATTFVEARYIGLAPRGLAVWNLGFRY